MVLVDESDKIKASFRSKGRINVAEIAAHFGGGGHIHAAACRMDVNTILDAKELLIKYLEDIL